MIADLASVGRIAGWLVAGGLTVAAAAAIVVLVNGDFDDTDGRVIFTSLGFALASATGSAGARALSRPSSALRVVGVATVACSVVAFGLLVVGTWTFDWVEGDVSDIWRWFVCTAIAGIAGAHACLMLGALKSTDTEAVRLLSFAAVCLGAFDALGVILPIGRFAEDVGRTWAQVFGSALVLLMLTSVLPPLLRKLQYGAKFASAHV